MTLSRETVHGLAALCGGIPDLAFTVTMTGGAQLRIAERPDASMCPHLFRQAVLAWPDAECFAPAIEAVAFDDFSHVGGVLACPGLRWFVAPMCGADTAACLEASGAIGDTTDAVVREDLDLGVSVVRLSRHGAEAALDDAAIAAYAVCLAEGLTRAASPRATTLPPL